MNRKFLRAIGTLTVYLSLAAVTISFFALIFNLIGSADAATEAPQLAIYLAMSFGSLVSGSVILLLVEIADAVAPVQAKEQLPKAA